MTIRRLYVDGKPVVLGSRIGKGGEGEVFAVADDSELALKIYTVQDGPAREDKVAAMVRAQLARKAPLVAFPTALARSKSGVFQGFVMRLVSGYKPLHELYAPGSRKQHFPYADYRFLVRAAANIARAIASVHKSGCVIGDINHSSILISSRAVVALIDADSFQVTDGDRRFLCKVGVPEYTAPELQDKPLSNIVRTPNHDAFGLAVVLFQILFMGRHPFVGKVRRGDAPPIHEAIKYHRYVYAEDRDVGIDQPPGTPVLSNFSRSIATTFDAALSRDGNRPTAAEWIQQLDSLENSLVQCRKNPLHYIPREAKGCAWCEMEEALHTVLFVAYIPSAKTSPGTIDPGAAHFDLRIAWAQIEKIECPSRASLLPRLGTSPASPSLDARTAKRKRLGPIFLRIAALAAAAVLATLLTPLWIVWLPLGLWGLFGRHGPPTHVAESAKQRYLRAETYWEQQLDNWYARCGLDDIEILSKELRDAKQQYESLKQEADRELARYREGRRERQLQSYLATFDIATARIPGIGSARQAALASYGIDTAADITLQKVLAVPGFGDVTAKRLVDWRTKHEKRFVYNHSNNAFDRQEEARIRGATETRAAALRRKLTAGPRNLQTLVARALHTASLDDPALRAAHTEREQARVDLKFLGIPPPQLQGSPSNIPTGWVPPASAATSQAPTGTPSCPRCGTRMVRRVSRRSANAGRPFWGCSRFPRCKGTRPI